MIWKQQTAPEVPAVEPENTFEKAMYGLGRILSTLPGFRMDDYMRGVTTVVKPNTDEFYEEIGKRGAEITRRRLAMRPDYSGRLDRSIQGPPLELVLRVGDPAKLPERLGNILDIPQKAFRGTLDDAELPLSEVTGRWRKPEPLRDVWVINADGTYQPAVFWPGFGAVNKDREAPLAALIRAAPTESEDGESVMDVHLGVGYGMVQAIHLGRNRELPLQGRRSPRLYLVDPLLARDRFTSSPGAAIAELDRATANIKARQGSLPISKASQSYLPPGDFGPLFRIALEAAPTDKSSTMVFRSMTSRAFFNTLRADQNLPDRFGPPPGIGFCFIDGEPGLEKTEDGTRICGLEDIVDVTEYLVLGGIAVVDDNKPAGQTMWVAVGCNLVTEMIRTQTPVDQREHFARSFLNDSSLAAAALEHSNKSMGSNLTLDDISLPDFSRLNLEELIVIGFPEEYQKGQFSDTITAIVRASA